MIGRKIKKLIIHCSASDVPSHDDISVIKNWHLERGWKDVGYHFFITKKGSLQQGRNTEEVGAHCEGHNQDSIGICLSGEKEFTEIQFRRLWELLADLKAKYRLTNNNIYPHKYFNKKKTCPNFDVQEVIQKNNLPSIKKLYSVLYPRRF